MVATLLECENLTVKNTGEPTHFHIQTGTLTCIDLTVTSSNCTLDFQWNVLDDLRSSDHFPIIISFDSGPPPPGTPKWLIEKADWRKFGELSDIPGSVDEIPSVDAAVEVLNSSLFSAGAASIPMSSGHSKRCPVPWWSNTISKLHRETRIALTRLKRHRTDANLVTQEIKISATAYY